MRTVRLWIVALVLLILGALAIQLHGAGCMSTFAFPEPRTVVVRITGEQQDAAWAMVRGKPYLLTATKSYPVCMTGDDPMNPIPEVVK